MNKFLIALLVAIFGFSFSNKTFAKTIIKNKNNIVDVVFILDRSGSMGGLESDTIGGFNSMLEKQRKIDKTLDSIRDKYGFLSVQNGSMLMEGSRVKERNKLVGGHAGGMDGII